MAPFAGPSHHCGPPIGVDTLRLPVELSYQLNTDSVVAPTTTDPNRIYFAIRLSRNEVNTS